MPHILPTSTSETIREEIGDYYPVFSCLFDAFAQSAQSAKRYKTLSSTHTRRDNLLFKSMIYPLFAFYYLWLTAEGYFLDNFNILHSWPNWYCVNK